MGIEPTTLGSLGECFTQLVWFRSIIIIVIMKSTEVQTLGELRMSDTVNWWAGRLVFRYSARRVWHVLATVVYSMRESIHAVCCDFLSLWGTKSEHPMRYCILAFSLSFTAYLSNAVVSRKRPFTFQARVVLKASTHTHRSKKIPLAIHAHVYLV